MITASAATHPGAVRTVNQDAFVNRPDLGLWAVADGAGGHDAGEVAAGAVAAALEALPPSLPAGELLVAVREALEAVHHGLRGDPGRVCASTVVVLMVRDGHFACLWAGDSRAYLLREGVLAQVTRDHSLVEELVGEGLLRPEDAEGHSQANVITRAVGAAADSLDLDKRSGPLLTGDRLLLCSDGVSKTLGDGQLASLLAGAHVAAADFIAAALDAQVSDNVTAITLRIDPPA